MVQTARNFSTTTHNAENEKYYPAKVYSDGAVQWNSPLVLVSTCRLNVQYFPWDQQVRSAGGARGGVGGDARGPGGGATGEARGRARREPGAGLEGTPGGQEVAPGVKPGAGPGGDTRGPGGGARGEARGRARRGRQGARRWCQG